jgi:hypothetical protein
MQEIAQGTPCADSEAFSSIVTERPELVGCTVHPAAALGHRLQGGLSVAERTRLALAFR